MEENLSDYRRSYEKSALNSENLTENPMHLFKKWFDEIERIDQNSENNAMTLSTIDLEGYPKNRIVLLKKFNDEGFVFYTNYTSEKALAIEENPKVSLSFFWPVLERQVVIKGVAVKVSSEESDVYFTSRPRGSQIGAWVSHQSHVIEEREVLEKRQLELEERFSGQSVPRPDFWGGYLIKPHFIEFWQGRPNRLHDRFRYSKQEKDWKIERLAP